MPGLSPLDQVPVVHMYVSGTTAGITNRLKGRTKASQGSGESTLLHIPGHDLQGLSCSAVSLHCLTPGSRRGRVGCQEELTEASGPLQTEDSFV